MSAAQRQRRLKREQQEFERSYGGLSPSGLGSFGPVKSVVWDVDGSPETEKSVTLAIDIVSTAVVVFCTVVASRSWF